jgi:hypothetical protein
MKAIVIIICVIGILSLVLPIISAILAGIMDKFK